MLEVELIKQNEIPGEIQTERRIKICVGFATEQTKKNRTAILDLGPMICATCIFTRFVSVHDMGFIRWLLHKQLIALNKLPMPGLPKYANFIFWWTLNMHKNGNWRRLFFASTSIDFGGWYCVSALAWWLRVLRTWRSDQHGITPMKFLFISAV